MIKREDFNVIADDMINVYFANFKDIFVFVDETETDEYDPDTGGYVKDVEKIEVEGITTSISKDLLASGIYSSSDKKVIFQFSVMPDFIDIGTKVEFDGRIFTVAEYNPDPSYSIINVILKR